VNLTAGLALIGDTDRAIGLIDADSRVEPLYNVATACVDARNFEKASELVALGLSRADPKSTYGQLLELLRAQIAATTEPARAAEAFDAMTEDESANAYVRTVAAANCAALTLDTNVHLAKKRMSLFDDNRRYPGYRKSEVEPFLINRFLILHKIGQPGKIKALVEFARGLPNFSRLVAESFDRTIDPMGAAATALSPLFVAQAFINQGKFADAARALAGSPLVRHPRTVAVVTELDRELAAATSEAACARTEIQWLRREADEMREAIARLEAKAALAAVFFHATSAAAPGSEFVEAVIRSAQ